LSAGGDALEGDGAAAAAFDDAALDAPLRLLCLPDALLLVVTDVAIVSLYGLDDEVGGEAENWLAEGAGAADAP